MPYADPEKRRVARRALYMRKKQRKLGAAMLWPYIDMMLAYWCVWLRPRIYDLDAIWRVVVPVCLYEGETGNRKIWQLGTRIMMRLNGQEYRLCEFEGENALDDLLRERAEFFWVVSRTAMRVRETQYANR